MENQKHFDLSVERQICWQAVEIIENRKNIFRKLRPEWFYDPICHNIFKSAFELFLKNEPFGFPELNAALKDKNVPILEILDEADHNYGSPGPLIDRIKELAMKRELYQRLYNAGEKLERESALNVGRYLAAAVMQTIGVSTAEEEPTSESLVCDALNRWGSEAKRGYSTGLEVVDNWMGGLVGGRLYVLGATKKTGKTRFTVSMLYHIATNSVQCSLITLEMRPLEIVDLLTAKLCKINSGKIENITLDEEDKRKIQDKIGTLKSLLDHLHMNASANLTIDGLEAIIRFHVSLYKSKIIAIDFLSKIMIDNKYENAETGKICHRLSSLARELNIAILLVVQLNKTAETISEPNIGMVEGTGKISQFADVIMLLVNDLRIRNDRPGLPAGEQQLKLQITQRQGACSTWIPITAQLQTLDFKGDPFDSLINLNNL